MKLRECDKKSIGAVGFIDPHVVNGYNLKKHTLDVENDLYMFLKNQEGRTEILFPYNFE